MKKLLWTLIIASALIVTLAVIFKKPLIARIVMQQAVPIMSGEKFAELGDGLHVLLCGAGSPLPDPKRSGPCTLVVAGTQVFVFDIGSGATGNIGPMGIPMANIVAVFLTHFHSDHIDGLGELALQRWAGGGFDQPLPVHGPNGVEQVVAGFNAAYQQDFAYRIEHHGADFNHPTGAGSTAVPFDRPLGDDAVSVFDDGKVKITAFSVTHEPISPALGYRIEYAGRSVVISGDTSPSENVQRYAQDADLLVHEAQSPEMLALVRAAAVEAKALRMVQLFDDILSYHTSPIEAATIAQAANVKHLLFTHIVPALPIKPMETLFLQGVEDAYSGQVTLGRDGTWVGLPANSSEIRNGNLLW